MTTVGYGDKGVPERILDIYVQHVVVLPCMVFSFAKLLYWIFRPLTGCIPMYFVYVRLAPVTFMGRAIAVFWMFAGLVLFGFFSGILVSYMTPGTLHYSIRGLRDSEMHESGHPSCAMKGLHEEYIKRFEMVYDQAIFVDNITDCYEMLAKNEVQRRRPSTPKLAPASFLLLAG